MTIATRSSDPAPLAALSRLKSSEAGVSTTRTTSRIACTTKPAKPSSAPAVNAGAGATPWRWKKRMLTAMRAALVGIAMLTYDTASCSA